MAYQSDLMVEMNIPIMGHIHFLFQKGIILQVSSCGKCYPYQFTASFFQFPRLDKISLKFSGLVLSIDERPIGAPPRKGPATLVGLVSFVSFFPVLE